MPTAKSGGLPRYCPKCKKTMSDINFYQYKSGEKAEFCKACLTMHVDNFEPSTFLWLLEKFDVPYIEAEWNKLRDKAYNADPHKMNGMSVFGKYLSKMKLKQWKDYTWADTERLKEEAEVRRKEAEEASPNGVDISEAAIQKMEEAYKKGEITEAQYKTYAAIHAPEPTYGRETDDEAPMISPLKTAIPANYYPPDAPFEKVVLEDVSENLTAEDKVYLAMKWGRFYSAEEWVALEQLYNEFNDSFDIRGASRINNLKLLCKTSLKMNQAIDAGDVENYQKLSKVYDMQMKSGKFSEVQQKEDKNNAVDCVGNLVAFCEEHGGVIPRHDLSIDYDILDTVIKDLKDYNKTLVYEDKSLATEIENYLAQKRAMDEQKKAREEAAEAGLDAPILDDDALAEFNEMIADGIEQDNEEFTFTFDEDDEEGFL